MESRVKKPPREEPLREAWVQQQLDANQWCPSYYIEVNYAPSVDERFALLQIPAALFGSAMKGGMVKVLVDPQDPRFGEVLEMLKNEAEKPASESLLAFDFCGYSFRLNRGMQIEMISSLESLYWGAELEVPVSSGPRDTIQ